MKTTADISWPGGKAKRGDTVDVASVPELTRARWVEDGILVEDGVDVPVENSAPAANDEVTL